MKSIGGVATIVLLMAVAASCSARDRTDVPSDTSDDASVVSDAAPSADSSSSDSTASDAHALADADLSSDASSDAAADASADVGIVDASVASCPYPAVRALSVPHDSMAGSLGTGTGRFIGTTCGGGMGQEDIYSLHIATRTGITVRDPAFGGTPGLVFSVRRACADASTEIACAGELDGYMRAALDPGDYYVIVDSDAALTYSLALATFVAAPNAACQDAAPLSDTVPLRAQDLAMGGGSTRMCNGSDQGWMPRLWYSIAIPPNRSATVTAVSSSQPTWGPLLEAIDACGSSSCVASSNGVNGMPTVVVIPNNSGSPRNVIVAAALGVGSPSMPYLIDLSVAFH